MLLNAEKCQDYSFYRFWVIKAKKTMQNRITFRQNVAFAYFVDMYFQVFCTTVS